MKSELLRINAGDSAVTRLQGAGLKVTGPRLAILARLERDPTHPSAEEVYAGLKPDHPSLSLSTVYKALEAFARVGLCRRLSGNGPTQRFDGTTHQHHHAVCRGCGRIFDVPAGAYQESAPPPRLPGGLAVRGIKVEFDVVCSACVGQTREQAQHRTAVTPPKTKTH